MAETISGNNVAVYDDLNTCMNFMRQTREELFANKPVSAYTSLQKAEEYAEKAREHLYDKKDKKR